ncbi:Predicted arabinose efflux permease, MFS family [Pseudomonas syringae]|uniref:MFS transporter n=1 Tax=Pseudomonas syringae TaxID=317 RepID=UPI00089C5925|nr:MFS transporter [Pseudomonas syringae]SDX66145.1 Predicted arabinose efflux permease, MFS family [Pseudomonas syringae]SFM74349.1 Predicted arabinose efflux permease, MFS family [Pseudomonas syringae]
MSRFETAANLETRPASWWAVGSVSLGSFATVTTEFLPVGLLPDIARDLETTVSHAGLMMAVPGLLAAISAPSCIALFSHVDRKRLLLGLLSILLASNLIVALSEQFWLTLAGRVLLGFALGGFWTIAGSLGPRLRQGREGVKATAYVLAGVSIGTVAGIPAGTLIGEAFGWRAAFETAAVVTVVVGMLIATLLPALPGERSAGLNQMLSLAGEQKIRRMFAAALLIYVGHFAAYTYLAPFVQDAASIKGQALGLLLFAFGLAAVAGNLAGGALAARNAPSSVLIMTVLMLGSLTLLLFVGIPWLLWPVILVWGFAFGMIPITTQIWCFDASNGRVEGVQALLVCVVNLSIGGGAFIGGLVSEGAGFSAAIVTGAVCAALSVATVGMSLRRSKRVTCAG